MANQTVIHLEYCGVPGSGPTVAAAKQDAARKIQTLMEDYRGPMLFHYRSYLAVLSLSPRGGWGYRLCDVADLPEAGYKDMDHCSTGFKDRAEAERALRRHLADLGHLLGAPPVAVDPGAPPPVAPQGEPTGSGLEALSRRVGPSEE